MIKRKIQKELLTLVNEYPVVTILGPRQAGKTTLAKMSLGESYEYSNLEEPMVRAFAIYDPKAYLSQFKGKVIIDEIQRCPELLSYIQVIVDEEKKVGKYVLTGSHQLKLQEAVTQSLAGRTAILNLLPLSIEELSSSGIKLDSFSEYCFNGFLPRVYDQDIRPSTLYSNYYQTYVERDVKLLINLKDLTLFEKLMKLLAGRVGQLIDYSKLGNDIGVDSKTIKNWLSILEASFIIYKLPPYFDNFGKRVVKSPKYYFTDVGLLCFLLGIEKPLQVARDPLVGNIFENLVVIEFLKKRYNSGKLANLYFFRDSNGNEVDIIMQKGRSLVPVEVKSASTFNKSFVKSIIKFRQIASQSEKGQLIYSGDFYPITDDYEVKNFTDVALVFDREDEV